MSDLDLLREASQMWFVVDSPEEEEAIAILQAAARRLLEAEEVWFCEEHRREGNRTACSGRARVEACPMVPAKLLVDPQEGESE